MTAAEIIKDIKARKFKPVYLLHGEESYLYRSSNRLY